MRLPQGDSLALGALAWNQVSRWRCLPLTLQPLTVLCSDLDLPARDGVQRLLGPVARIEYWEQDQFSALLDCYGPLMRLAEDAQNALGRPSFSVTPLCHALLDLAARLGASDLRVENFSAGTALRLRIDGVLYPLPSLSAALGGALIAAFKAQCGMDASNRRAPQDGRSAWTVGNEGYDLRASSLPTLSGESLALRLLPRGGGLTLEQLGAPPQVQQALSRLTRCGGGLVLSTGPTGSGKTTTQYALLRLIDRWSTNVITLEDPVEYRLEGVNQVVVNEAAGCDFAQALRAVLRQDPDVVVVGEIRDILTARLALRLALTGHLVFSTLHTVDAASAPLRLVEMGLPPYLVAGCLKAVIAQRLLRRSAEGGSYRGRVAVFELLQPGRAFAQALIDGVPLSELRELARAGGCSSLRQSGLALAGAGLTTEEEVLAHTPEDDDEG